MRASRIVAVLFVLTCAGSSACGSKTPPPREEQPLAPPKKVEAPPAPSAAAAPNPIEEHEPSAEELPLPEDFTADAEKQIKRKNLRAELDVIEKELDAEK